MAAHSLEAAEAHADVRTDLYGTVNRTLMSHSPFLHIGGRLPLWTRISHLCYRLWANVDFVARVWEKRGEHVAYLHSVHKFGRSGRGFLSLVNFK